MNQSTYLFVLFGILLAACQPKEPSPETPKTPSVDLIFEIGAQLGEGAFWNPENQLFYWVDIEGKRLHVFDPATRKNRSIETSSRIGTVVPMNDTMAIVALEDGAYLMNTETGTTQPYASIEAEKPWNRLNDGKCDPAGRFWVGSMSFNVTDPTGALYRVDGKDQITKMLDSITVSNGIVWTSDKKTMYYIDTPSGNIRGFDYNNATGDIENERVAVVVPDSLGLPDGMTIDAEDKLWVGMWNGNAIIRFDPIKGEVMERIPVPAHNVTSCAFGGPNLDTLYITSAKIDMTEAETAEFPLAGSLFQYVPGVNGVSSDFFSDQK